MLIPTDKNAAVIEPQKGKREEPLPSMGVLTFTPQDLSLFSRCFTEYRKLIKIYLADLIVGRHADASIALAGPALGAPQTVLILEKLIALGVRDLVAVGWCGSLQPDVRIGDVVLPTGAVSEEGTSKHYPISTECPGPSSELLFSLKAALNGAFPKVHEGNVWSTDAPFRETVGKVLGYREEGILAVDMEVSALFTVAHFRGIRLATVLVVSDELFTLNWHHGFKDPGFQQTREKLPERIFKALSSVRPRSL